MTTLKSIGYTVLILACITLAFVVIPVIGFICSVLLTVAIAAFFAYFIYVGVNIELKDKADRENKA